MFEGIGSVLGGITSGVMSMIGASAQNSMNKNAADRANNFNQAMMHESQDFSREMWDKSKQYNTDMAFQTTDWANRSQDKALSFARETFDRSEAMQNSAYQRATADMRAAGINPLLAYQQGGAGSVSPMSGPTATPGSASMSPPSSPTAAGGQRAQMENVLGPAVSAALQGAQVVQGLENLEAQVNQTQANTDLLRANARNVDVNTGLQTAQTITETGRPDLVRAETGRSRAQAGQATASTAQQHEETRDYRRWGPPGVIRDPLVTGERVGERIAPTVAPAIRGAAGHAAEAVRGAAEAGGPASRLGRDYRRDPRSWREIIDQTILRHLR